MWYFDYQCNERMGGIWDLFSGLSEISQADWKADGALRCQYGHTLEILETARRGKLGSNSVIENEYFNLRAYELACQGKDKVSDLETAKKYLHIVDADGEDMEDLRVGYGEISSRKLKTDEFLFEEFENSSTFESNLMELFNAKARYLIEYGVDIVRTLTNSLKGIPSALKELTNILARDSWLKEIVEGLCEGAAEGVLLQRLELGC